MANKTETIEGIQDYSSKFLSDDELHFLKDSDIEVYADIYNKYEFVKTACSHLLNIDLTLFPDSLLVDISNNLVRLSGIYNSLKRKGTNSTNQTIANTKNSHDHEYPQFFKNIQPFLSITNANPLDKINKLTQDVIVAHEKMQANSKEIEDSLKVIQGYLSAAESATEQLGIVKYGTIFRDEAKSYSTAAKWWLFIVSVLLSLTIGLAVFLFFHEKEIENVSTPVGAIATRVIVFAALFIAISLSIKNYKVNRHNQIVCTHRQNALNTFETFVKTSNDDITIKNAILMEVTRTIFNTHSTGYISKDTDADSPNRIVEIIKNITDSRS